jgi:hypothetical protein
MKNVKDILIHKNSESIGAFHKIILNDRVKMMN